MSRGPRDVAGCGARLRSGSQGAPGRLLGGVSTVAGEALTRGGSRWAEVPGERSPAGGDGGVGTRQTAPVNPGSSGPREAVRRGERRRGTEPGRPRLGDGWRDSESGCSCRSLDGCSRSHGGGSGEIRTHGGLSPTHAFEACSLGRSDTLPRAEQYLLERRSVKSPLLAGLRTAQRDATCPLSPFSPAAMCRVIHGVKKKNTAVSPSVTPPIIPKYGTKFSVRSEVADTICAVMA